MTTSIKTASLFTALVITLAGPAFAGEYEFEEQIKVDGTPDVRVTLRSGDVSARPAKGDVVIVKATGDIGGKIRVDGNSMVISDMNGAEDAIADSDVALELPAGSELTITTISGDVSIRGLSGKTRVTTVSGKLDMKDIRGPSTFKVVSGDVRIENIASSLSGRVVSGEMKGRSISGDLAEIEMISSDVSIEDLLAKQVRLKSVSGDIRVKGALSEEAIVKVKTVSGDAEFSLPAGADFEANLRSRSGDLQTDFEGASRDRTGGSSHVKVGQGGADIEMTSLSGDLKIMKQE